MFLQISVLLIALFAQATEQTKCRNFKLGPSIVGVGMDNHLYMRRSTSNKFSWIKVPRSCCVTQIHIMANGLILGIGLRGHIYKRKSLYSSWSKVPNSCCVKDVTTFRTHRGGPLVIVGVGTNGKLYSKRSLGGRWTGPHPYSGTVKAVSGVIGTIYGVGTNNHIYRRSGLRGRWAAIPGSCCVKDIFVRPTIGHPVYAIGTNNRLYTASLENTCKVRWTDRGTHTCCIKAVAIQRRSSRAKIIGVGLKKQLWVKPTLSAPWGYVLNSGSVLSITALKNGFLVGVGTNKHLYYRKSFDGHPWKKVPNSCCVKSIMQLKNGLIVGVGMRNRLWVRQNLFTRWSLRIPNSGYVTSITTGPRNKIIGIGTNKRIYMRHYLTSRWIGPLANSGKVIDVSYSSDGHLYGVGTNKRIYKKRSRSLTSLWRILPKYNCCVKSIVAC